MIPNILHFVFGMAPDFGGKPFCLAHYLSIKSAVATNKPTAVFFHYEFEPSGEWWEQAKPLVTLHKTVAPDSFMGRELHHVAHKADVIRLQALKKFGGIYLDLDTISVRPLQELLSNSFVIGKELKPKYSPKNWRQEIKHAIKKRIGFDQEHQVSGLCNAVLMAQPENEFVNMWLDTYASFRSKGKDKYWNEHSVQVPTRLAADHPNSATVLGPFAFHYPLYDNHGLESMFEKVTDFPDAYLHHLWESFSWDRYLSQLTVNSILTKDTTYNLIARKFI